MKASDYIATTLAEKNVPAVFELIGGMITHMVDSIHTHGKTRIVSMRHEQGAAFAAEAAGRISGIPGVAMATSGPGATNLLTGIGSCYFDSSPAVFITGQVNRNEQKGNRSVRQLGFQETDIAAMAAPITKKVFQVQDAEHLPQILDEAFLLATSGRRGPVLIDIPMDVQRDSVSPSVTHPSSSEHTESHLTADLAQEIVAAVLKAKRPMILVGGGVRTSMAVEAFRSFVTAAGVPAVHSLMACDVLPYADPMNAGMIGSYGNRWSNLALTECDCLIVLGSRLDVRQTGSDTEGFKGTRPIFNIDIERGEMNNRVENCTAIYADLNTGLRQLTETFAERTEEIEAHTQVWRSEIEALRNQWPDTGEFVLNRGINPNAFMHQLSAATRGAGAYVTDVGQHQMWSAQSLEFGPDQRWLTSGGMGSMGFALPAAVGAAVVLDGRPVVMVAGDGGFQCNIQELETVAHLGLPLKMIIINNECHGMVRQFQESYFHGRYQSTMWGYSAPNFERIADAYGIPSKTVSESTDIDAAMAWLRSEEDRPGLLQVMVDPMTNAYPKLAFGRGMSSMEPHEQPLEMEGT